MANDLLEKLIRKIDFEHANNFELAVAKDYSFVPISSQGESFFVAVSPDANKERIIEYVKPIVNKKVEFIFLSRQNFEILFENFLKGFSSTFGSVVSEQSIVNPFGEVEFETAASVNQVQDKQNPQTVVEQNDSSLPQINLDEIDLNIDDEPSEDLITLDENEQKFEPTPAVMPKAEQIESQPETPKKQETSRGNRHSV